MITSDAPGPEVSETGAAEVSAPSAIEPGAPDAIEPGAPDATEVSALLSADSSDDFDRLKREFHETMGDLAESL